MEHSGHCTMLTFDLEGWNAEEKVDRIKLHVNICVQAKVFFGQLLIEKGWDAVFQVYNMKQITGYNLKIVKYVKGFSHVLYLWLFSNFFQTFWFWHTIPQYVLKKSSPKYFRPYFSTFNVQPKLGDGLYAGRLIREYIRYLNFWILKYIWKSFRN